MWSWISEIIKGLFYGLRIIFGTDKPAVTTVIEKEAPVNTADSDDVLLDELRNSRPKSGNSGSDPESGPADADPSEHKS